MVYLSVVSSSYIIYWWVLVLIVLPIAGDQLSAILNSIQSRPSLPAPSIFDQAAKPPSSLVHSPFVFGQSPSYQQPQPPLQSKSVPLTCSTHPFCLKQFPEFLQRPSLLCMPSCLLTKKNSSSWLCFWGYFLTIEIYELDLLIFWRYFFVNRLTRI